MKIKFSTNWNSSTQVRKQRKFRFNAPAHLRSKFISSSLSKDLRKKYGTRSARIRVGDTVKIICGNHKGKESKVERINLTRSKVYLEKIRSKKKDGTEIAIPLDASNMIIISAVSDDKTRFAKTKDISGEKKK